jgi:hypothetical protein
VLNWTHGYFLSSYIRGNVEWILHGTPGGLPYGVRGWEAGWDQDCWSWDFSTFFLGMISLGNPSTGIGVLFPSFLPYLTLLASPTPPSLLSLLRTKKQKEKEKGQKASLMVQIFIFTPPTTSNQLYVKNTSKNTCTVHTLIPPSTHTHTRPHTHTHSS